MVLTPETPDTAGSHGNVERAAPLALVLASGKGGVGKSVLAILFAAALSSRGRRVLLVDGSQNLATLHVLLGVQPRFRLEQLYLDSIEPADLIVPVRDGLSLLPGDSGAQGLYGLTSVNRARLHYQLTTLYRDYDAVVIDADHTLEGAVRVATMGASRLIAVAVPEPAALNGVFALLRIVIQQVGRLPVDLLINRARDEAEGRTVFTRLATAAQRLPMSLNYLGTLPNDPAMAEAVREPHRLLQLGSDSALGRAVAALVTDQVDPLALPCPGTISPGT